MPELPEVEVVRAGLEPVVTGARVDDVEVLDRRSLRRHDAIAGGFEARLAGRTVVAAVRRGKFLWLPLSASQPGGELDEALVVHLGMSGQVLLREVAADSGHLLRIRMVLSDARAEPFEVHFVDQRIFGSMAIDRLVATPDGLAGGSGFPLAAVPGQVAHIARDPLDPAFDAGGVIRSLRARRTQVKRALLDQTLASGIGNIYADESLWAARIHPLQPTPTLSRARAATLFDEVRAVLGRALAEGGTSFDQQYVNVNGASGYFSRSLAVYGREGEPCPRCGTAIRRAPFMNRSSHYCPRCQRLRAAR